MTMKCFAGCGGGTGDGCPHRATVRSGVLAALLLSLAGTLAMPARGQDTVAEWTGYHGPYRDNRSADSGLLKHWPEGGPRLLWTASGLGLGYSSVALSAGLLYSAGMTDKQTFVIALSLDGRERWRQANGPAWEAGQGMRYAAGYAGARATPTCDQGHVYHLSETGILGCFGAATGEVVWHLDLPKAFEAKIPKYGYAESVLIDGGRLICSPAGAKGAVVCLDKSSGRTVWANSDVPGSAGYTSCRLAEVAGRRQLLGMTAKVAFGLDPESGRTLWTVEHGNPRENNATDPVLWNNQVVLSSGYGAGSRLVRLTPGAEGVAAETAWSTKLLDNHHGGIMALDGFLYGAGHEAKGWHCLDLRTGQPRWTAPGKGALTWADGLLYCLEERGTMTLVEPSPEVHRELSSFRLPSGGDGLYWAHPVVCGGRLYIRHAEALFAYDVRAH
jgi:outer membrane protein assembly factor BamB